MKILFTSPYQVLPANSGGAVRTLNIAKAFARLGHDVQLLCATPTQDTQEPEGIGFRYFDISNPVAHFYNWDFIAKLSLCLEETVDMVLVGFPYQAWMIDRVMRKYNVPLVYDAHNVEADRFKKMGRPLVSLLVKMAERKLCRLSDLLFTVSEEDRQLMQDVHGRDSVVLPNGVDTTSMEPGSVDDSVLERYGLETGNYTLYFGSYDYPPNVEAVQFLVGRVWPKVVNIIPDAKLAIVGRGPKPWMKGHTGILVTGPVDSIVEVIKGARIVVVPLFSGGGTRLKIIEALACGKTILATSFGATGIVREDTSALRLAEPEFFTEKLLEILQQPINDICGNTQARELSKRFDWQTLAQEVEPKLITLQEEMHRK